MFQTSAIPVLEQLVRFSQARHEVLAGNIANVDTPGYRSRDLSEAAFQSKLREAIDARRAPRESWSLGAHSAAPAGDPVAQVGDGLGSILHHDDSNVGVEQQVAAITKNQMQHNLAITVLGSQYRLLAAAISERL